MATTSFNAGMKDDDSADDAEAKAAGRVEHGAARASAEHKDTTKS
jgi:hypothetical protein